MTNAVEETCGAKKFLEELNKWHTPRWSSKFDVDEMANLNTDMTNAEYDLWVDDRKTTMKHNLPRLKIHVPQKSSGKGKDSKQDGVPMCISENPRFLADSSGIRSKKIKKVKEFIVKHRKPLVTLYYSHIKFDIRDLLDIIEGRKTEDDFEDIFNQIDWDEYERMVDKELNKPKFKQFNK